MIEGKCLQCGKYFAGRKGRKFCSDACRTAYNNVLNADETNHMRNVNNVLRKNRRILLGVSPDKATKVSKHKLSELGFTFEYFTNVQTNKNNQEYKYCYEKGYLELDNNTVLVVTRK